MSARGEARPTWLALGLLLSALSGALVSTLLFLRQEGGGSWSWLSALCGPAGALGCDLVERSPLAQPFGVSLALLGCAYYGAVLVSALAGLVFASGGAVSVLCALSALGLLVDAGLASYSLFVLGTLCGLCGLTYLATLGCAAFSFGWLRASERALVPPSFRPRREVAAFVSAGGLAVLAALGWLGARVAPTTPAAFTADPDRALRLAWDAFHAHFHAAPVRAVETDGAPRMGAARPVLELVLFADFACRHCERAATILGEFVERHREEAALVFKHYPLDSACNPGSDAVHPGSCLLARAASAAGPRAFWRLEQRLFAQGERWQRGVTPLELVALAAEVGLDPEAYRSALDSEGVRALVAADLAQAETLGVTGTPTLFVNGRRLASIPIPTFLEELLVAEREERPGFGAAAFLERGANE